ncbi:hypothetical protein LZ480_06255 [Solibacillus sp. MA9]|uniref:Selenocysteine lyase n=1 Tax=Solibacillus palustris TaxID=2908203 RepID=A0ABS9UB96_9BACL|nr:hypothetical protein [Solibacillus sp. MA9]MCH7321493.1 hypothetical protein [Solibacillus sp. MA9]
MSSIIYLIFFMSPLYAVIIWSYLNPKESLLWGKRGIFKEEPEVTEAAIRQAKVTAIFGLIWLTFMLLLGIMIIYIYY